MDRTDIRQKDDQGVPLSARAHDVRGIFENHPRDDKCPAIIVLGRLSHSAYLMRSALFISSKALRETQIYKFEMKSTVENWNTNFLGTYTPNNFSASRTPLTRPLPGDSLNQLPSVPSTPRKGQKDHDWTAAVRRRPFDIDLESTKARTIFTIARWQELRLMKTVMSTCGYFRSSDENVAILGGEFGLLSPFGCPYPSLSQGSALAACTRHAS